MPIRKGELRDAAAKVGDILGSIAQDVLKRSAHAAAEVVLEEVENRIRDGAEHVGKVRQRARRGREAPIDVPGDEGGPRRRKRS